MNSSIEGLATKPLGEAFGLEIMGVDLGRLDDDQMAGIMTCLDRASALLIRGQSLSPEALQLAQERGGTMALDFIPPLA